VLSFGLWKERADPHKPPVFEVIECFDKMTAVERNSIPSLVMLLNF